MSQENVEAVRRAYEALEDNDLDAFLAELQPDVEWHPSIEPALEGVLLSPAPPPNRPAGKGNRDPGHDGRGCQAGRIAARAGSWVPRDSLVFRWGADGVGAAHGA
jgi:hypothetical protein